ncbi:terminase small subunit protein [Bradyrhizobium quebecense]|nr:terminase small subunit protein [Bradyrhizobium quebecense]UGA46650.1 terminase small subunit protein [Bradyrhizobium quebecense]
MAEGESLRSICRDEEMPGLSTVFLWLSKDKAFVEQYARAIDARSTVMEEEILQISDDASGDVIEGEDGSVKVNAEFVARSRLKVDTRKWLMARMSPKKYGDKLTTEVTGADGGPIKQEISRIELVAAPFPSNIGEG